MDSLGAEASAPALRTGIADEVRAIQNPALGAVLLWRFAVGFGPTSLPRPTPLPLMYLVLPVLYHSQTADRIASTRAGLRKVEEKFAGSGDVLLLLQPRMLAMRSLTLRSLRIGMRAGLLDLVPSEASLWPISDVRIPPQPAGVAGLLKSAEKLGGWSASMTLYEVARTLKLEL